ncbi:MAG TPA: nucleoside phosphorylase, partial [Geobacteraceae bacterium]|nr:nucleoside phosphorylase [Geobacteraceae bacterium]
VRRAGTHRREKVAGFNLYRFTLGNRDVSLIESGIGAARAAEAAGILIDSVSPGVILSFGFAGAVLPGPAVGDIIVGDRLLFFRERLFTEQKGLPPGLPEKLAAMLEEACRGRSFRIHRGTLVTTGEIVDKHRLAGLLPAGTANPAVEMETVAVARAAARAGIPLVAIRAVSDGAEEELGFSIDEFADREMNISAWKVLRTIAVKPRIIPQLFRLARNSKIAGENLAVAVSALVERLQTTDLPHPLINKTSCIS